MQILTTGLTGKTIALDVGPCITIGAAGKLLQGEWTLSQHDIKGGSSLGLTVFLAGGAKKKGKGEDWCNMASHTTHT